MESAFYAMLVVAFILLVLLIALIIKLAGVTQNTGRVIDDNKRLASRLQRLDNEATEAKQSRENLLTQYEELKDLYEDVNRVAFTDKLTDLPNYTQFNDIIEGVMVTLRDGELAALSIIRLGNYDRVTNASGHASGDELILDFTGRLKANLTDDDFLSRISPDEFAIISQNFENIAELEERYAKLFRILHNPIENNGREIVPEIYMGATVSPNDGKNVQILDLNVHLALARAISEGGMKVVFYERSMAEEAMKRMELTAQLGRAVNDNDFTYLCGAQVELKTGRVSSFEIIPAFENGMYGRMLPVDYLKYAEDTHIAKRLFSLLLRAACSKQKVFDAAGAGDVDLIVPCFVGQFIDDDFVKIVYSILEETDATPTRILISIPESVMLKNLGATITLMKKIEKLGVRFILDDFGSGSSSLTALLTAPVSLVRLSGKLLDGNARIEPESFLLSFVELIHSWKLKLVASDVDLAEQEKLLKKVRADYAQGMLYNGYMEEEMALQLARISKK